MRSVMMIAKDTLFSQGIRKLLAEIDPGLDISFVSSVPTARKRFDAIKPAVILHIVQGKRGPTGQDWFFKRDAGVRIIVVSLQDNLMTLCYQKQIPVSHVEDLVSVISDRIRSRDDQRVEIVAE